MPSAKCGGCAKYLSPLGAARCSACKAIFHRACGSLPPSGSVAPLWRCPGCTNKGEGAKCVDTMAIQCVSEESTDFMACGGDVVTDIPAILSSFKEELRGELRQMFKEEFLTIRTDFFSEFQRLRTDLTQLQEDRDHVKGSIDTLKGRLDTMDAKMATFEKQLLGPSEAIAEVVQLRRELNDRDQDLLSNDLEISNLPESNNENLTHTVKTIAIKLGVTIEDRDVVSADRVGGGRVNATSAAGAVQTRMRPIVVRLARRDLRDELLRAARVRRGASTTDLNMPGPPHRFYVNERLTKFNRQLFRQAREAGQRLGWKYVWTKHGRILARHKSDDKASIIRQESDMVRVFGPDAEQPPQM